jgi:hypothetical protein
MAGQVAVPPAVWLRGAHDDYQQRHRGLEVHLMAGVLALLVIRCCSQRRLRDS